MALVLRGATLIDGHGGLPLADAMVRVEGDTIAAAGASAALPSLPGDEELDLHGRWLIPGLVDAHVHIGPPQAERLPLSVAAGVTTVLDLGGQVPHLQGYREAVATGRRTGPRIFFTGPMLEEGEPYEGFASFSHRMTRPVEDEVNRLADQGVDAIKLYITIRPETARRAVRAAHFRGLPVFMHGQATWGDDAATAGVDGLEHLMAFGALAPVAERPDAARMTPFEYGGWLWHTLAGVDVEAPAARTLVQRLVDANVALDPTLVLFAARPAAMGDDGGDTVLDDPEHAPAMRYLAPETVTSVRGRWLERRAAADRASEDARARTRAAWANMLALVGAFHRAGGRVLAGTDSPNVAIVPGYSLHRELELLTRTGMTPMDALVAATRHPAERLGRAGAFGTIEPGAAADLLVLSADPLADIRNTRSIERLLLRGRLLDPALLLKAECRPHQSE